MFNMLMLQNLFRTHRGDHQTVKVLCLALETVWTDELRAMKMNGEIHHSVIRSMVVIRALILATKHRHHHQIPLHICQIVRQHHH